MDNSSFYEKSLLVFVGGILTIIGSLILRWLNAKIPEEKELKLLILELEDIERHCNANLEILDMMDLNKGIPSAMHFEKMKVPEASILFSSETYRRIHTQHSKLIHRMKLIVRNINIELAEVIKYSLVDKCDRQILADYIEFIRKKMVFIATLLPIQREKLYQKTGLEPDDDVEEERPVGRPKYIIFDRQFK